MSEMIEQYELADRLRELVVGRRIVAADGRSLTLDDGTVIEVDGSSDCCAWGDAGFSALADSQNVVTSVTSADAGEGGYIQKAQVFILTDAGPALTVDQSWDESNGYYFYGLYLKVWNIIGGQR